MKLIDVLPQNEFAKLSPTEQLAQIRKLRVFRLTENLPKSGKTTKTKQKRFDALKRVRNEITEFFPPSDYNLFSDILVEYETLKRELGSD